MPEVLTEQLPLFRLSVRSDLAPDHGGEVWHEVRDPDGLDSRPRRHVLLFVHGFNNTRKEAENSYEIQRKLLEERRKPNLQWPDAIAYFQWPGDVAISPLRFSWLDALGYHLDIEQARKAAKRLAVYLAKLPRVRGDAATSKISVIGHSLGCRLILEALSQVSAGAPPFEVVSFMAPAVPVELVGPGGKLTPRVSIPRRILKFFSGDDSVLRFAFPLGQRVAFNHGIEAAAYREAVGLHGNPPGFGEPKPRHGNGHSVYWADKEAADTFAENIDPTSRAPLAARSTAERALPPQTSIAERRLERRNLPG